MRFADDTFSDSFISTIGVDFKIRTMEVEGQQIKLQIWDTAGQERFRTITASFYRGANGIILVYDVTNPETFINIQKWMKDIDHYAIENLPKLLVGNKVDLVNDRKVTTKEAQELALKLNLDFVESSAKNSSNIHEIFMNISSQIFKNI
uniref:Uncharacterized protein n=1 Tax=Arcella intermedia TaxID=1963864 RepID=A0A6B2LMF4_9EUKA